VKHLKTLFIKEVRLEFRNKSVFSGLILYLFSTVFICYLTLRLNQNQISPGIWSALFWIIILFTAVNSVAKSFIAEKKVRDIYYYSVANPTDIILSKILYNFFLCAFLSFSGYFLFVLFLNNPISDMGLMSLVILLTAMGFSGSLTLLSGIAGKTNNSSVVMAILSFPVILGILLTAIKVTKNCIDGLDRSVSLDELLMLGAINLLVAAVSYLLFPYIWRS
jgi:heme exporter protein B